MIACERAVSVYVARLLTMLCVRSVRVTAPEGGRRRRARCAMPRGADALPIRRAFALGIVRVLRRGGVIAPAR